MSVHWVYAYFGAPNVLRRGDTKQISYMDAELYYALHRFRASQWLRTGPTRGQHYRGYTCAGYAVGVMVMLAL